MVISSPLGLLWFLIVVCALFAALIVWGVRMRNRQLARNLTIRAGDITAPLVAAGWDPAEMLYGVWQDFSATNAGMVVRDAQDREVARITYLPLTRQGWIVIETGAGRFEADVLRTLRQTAILREAGQPEVVLCRFARLHWWGTFRIDVNAAGAGAGPIVGRTPWQFRITTRTMYSRGGTPIGVGYHIGGTRDRGRLLVLPADIPLVVRLFILAV